MILKGRHAEALTVVTQALAATPDAVELLVERVRLLRLTGSTAEAQDALATLALRRPAPATLLRLRAELATASGDLVAAERICAEEVAAHPRNASRLARWARALMQLGRHDEAAVALERGFVADPGAAGILVGKVELLTATGQLDAAEAALRALRERHPEHERLPRLQAVLADGAGDHERAERSYAADVAARPGDISRRIRWARALSRLGRHDGALTAIAEGLEAAPHSVELKAERIGPLLALKQYPAAQAEIETLERARPADPRLTEYRARLADAAGDVEATERLWAAHVAAHPLDAKARIRWARCQVRLDRHAEAQAVVADGLGRAPDHPELLAAHVPLLSAIGRFDAAAAGIDALSARSPDHPQLAQLRADLAEATGDVEEAERISAAVSALRPGDAGWRLQWARRLKRLGRADEALTVVSDGLRIAPDDAELALEQATLRIGAAQFAEAEQGIDDFEQRHPEHPGLAYLHARFAEGVGDLDAALRAYAADAAAFPDDVKRRVRWLRYLQQCGLIAEALAALDGRPLAPAEVLLRVDCLTDSGRWDEAIDLLDDWPFRDSRGQLLRLRLLMDLAWMRLDHAASVQHAQAILAVAPHDHVAAQGVARAATCLFRTDLAWDSLDRVRIRGIAAGDTPRRGVRRLREHIGQIVNELRLRPAATAALAGATERGDNSLIATAAAQLRAEPGSFAAALGLLLGLARAGRLRRARRADAAGPAQIPRIVHQFWDKAELPPDIERLMRRAAEINAGCEHRRWDDAAAQRHLSERGMKRALQAFLASRHPAQRADIFRLAVLYDMGGLYLDADDYCAQPLHRLIASDAALVCYQENIGSIGNNFLAARPGHPIIGAALDEAVETVLGGAAETLWLVTGPGVITRAVAGAIASQLSCAVPADLQILPLEVFMRTVHTVRKASYKTDARSWKRAN